MSEMVSDKRLIIRDRNVIRPKMNESISKSTARALVRSYAMLYELFLQTSSIRLSSASLHSLDLVVNRLILGTRPAQSASTGDRKV